MPVSRWDCIVTFRLMSVSYNLFYTSGPTFHYIREFKQRRRRRRGQRLVKNDLYFTSEIRDCLDLFGSPMAEWL